LVEELAGVRGEGLHVLALAFGEAFHCNIWIIF
jgi:hypothetical protein